MPRVICPNCSSIADLESLEPIECYDQDQTLTWVGSHGEYWCEVCQDTFVIEDCQDA
jgi:hypothetical protein